MNCPRCNSGYTYLGMASAGGDYAIPVLVCKKCNDRYELMATYRRQGVNLSIKRFTDIQPHIIRDSKNIINDMESFLIGKGG